jgi:hypothetical protein
MSKTVKFVVKAQKQRNAVARELCCNANFKPRIVRDRTKYSRKSKCRADY